MSVETRCGGYKHRPAGQQLRVYTCDRPAVLKGEHHGCVTLFKCIQCWQKWLQCSLGAIYKYGTVRCLRCGGRFASVESFADYRPF